MSGEGPREGEGKYLTLPRGGNVSWSPASISYRGAQKALSFVESWYSYGFGIMAQMLITVNRHTHTHIDTHSHAHTRYPLGNWSCAGTWSWGHVQSRVASTEGWVNICCAVLCCVCVCVCSARDICSCQTRGRTDSKFPLEHNNIVRPLEPVSQPAPAPVTPFLRSLFDGKIFLINRARFPVLRHGLLLLLLLLLLLELFGLWQMSTAKFHRLSENILQM